MYITTIPGRTGRKEKPMSIHEILEKLTAGEVAGWAAVILIVLFSLIQISPIKLNPWDRIFGWIGKKINGTMHDQMEELKKAVRDLWINDHRQSILNFARECRACIEHDAEEWNHILAVAEEYEMYCEKNTVSNGVVKADTAFIRDLYQELSKNHQL